MRRNPKLNRCLTAWLTLNHGLEGYADDPLLDLETWSTVAKNKELFNHTKDGK